MTQIIFLPHPEICPEGAIVQAHPGDNLIEIALAHGIELEHACEMSCACTTCHVLVREGFNSLTEADDLEDDLLDKAWGLEAESRLSCQIEVGEEDLVIEIPKYTLNQVSEG
ncbi:MAG: ISC system 2Fe-2S type ferredoxin [Pseudomonadales bacterium]|jgi:2Fe-2S ferredoxin|nr:ISC system 2Fe-2S type ferredoxin [Pseudomonadales bacterium]MDP7145584.1 ISC system 2Fe-2S type ferredoxin [Pseudomonadales bacterium]MDP7359942.1 ISC system 2Fe-2S type ferredoxin [Pseudomonadales bacterium]MDP7594578.1 ISC system 2Fe-2S type ferredoxin [Pseudomonadales bacterium]HJN52286.1 ISC system 2Fe-2S type ferredoxin [Pseudomonadales bacterium]|tara:strand:+ start:1842 stop:2177 length:336 start_codon:yes stop_codon:yes gene_type:complete